MTSFFFFFLKTIPDARVSVRLLLKKFTLNILNFKRKVRFI